MIGHLLFGTVYGLAVATGFSGLAVAARREHRRPAADSGWFFAVIR